MSATPSSTRKSMPGPYATPKTSSLTSSSVSNKLSQLSYKPTLVEVGPMRFVIMDAPRQTNLHLYIKELTLLHVKHVVRVCEPTYHADAMMNAGITCHDMEYPDGHSPPDEIIEQWLQLVESTFYNNTKSKNTKTKKVKEEHDKDGTQEDSGGGGDVSDDQVAVAVHCVAGLGRAPVLVVIALIEFAHMDAVEAVTMIRRLRKGSINEKQLLYLEGYKRRYKRKLDGGSNHGNSSGCIVM